MNRSCAHEAEALREAGVTVMTPGPRGLDGSVLHQGRRYSLQGEDRVAAFVAALQLPEDVGRKLEQLLLDLDDPDRRAVVANLASAWAPAERGGSIPSRLVFSGHSFGEDFWGDANGMIELRDLRGLAAVMPKAAAQIEDLALHGCETGGEERVERWRSSFPNLKTAWAYAGSAPGSHSGAVPHLTRWERATRGRAETLDPEIAARFRKGENVATWSAQDGYRPGRTEAKRLAAEAEQQSWEGPFEAYFSGEREATNPQQGELRQHYASLQRILGTGGLTPGDEAHLTRRAAQSLRLLYYRQKIAPAFAEHNAGQIRTGYEALGLDAPDFGKLSRKEALAEINRFRSALRVDRLKPAEAVALEALLVRGLRDLERELIPDRWI